MDDSWLSGFGGRLARCLGEAGECAAACERLLERAQEHGDAELQQAVVDAVIRIAAEAQTLAEMTDHPAGLILAMARLCRDEAELGSQQLRPLAARIECEDALAALSACASCCKSLLAAAGQG